MEVRQGRRRRFEQHQLFAVDSNLVVERMIESAQCSVQTRKSKRLSACAHELQWRDENEEGPQHSLRAKHRHTRLIDTRTSTRGGGVKRQHRRRAVHQWIIHYKCPYCLSSLSCQIFMQAPEIAAGTQHPSHGGCAGEPIRALCVELPASSATVRKAQYLGTGAGAGSGIMPAFVCRRSARSAVSLAWVRSHTPSHHEKA